MKPEWFFVEYHASFPHAVQRYVLNGRQKTADVVHRLIPEINTLSKERMRKFLDNELLSNNPHWDGYFKVYAADNDTYIDICQLGREPGES